MMCVKTRGSRRPYGVLMVAGTLAGSLILAGCGGDSAPERAAPLERDPSGRPVLPGGTPAPAK